MNDLQDIPSLKRNRLINVTGGGIVCANLHAVEQIKTFEEVAGGRRTTYFVRELFSAHQAAAPQTSNE